MKLVPNARLSVAPFPMISYSVPSFVGPSDSRKNSGNLGQLGEESRRPFVLASGTALLPSHTSVSALPTAPIMDVSIADFDTSWASLSELDQAKAEYLPRVVELDDCEGLTNGKSSVSLGPLCTSIFLFILSVSV